MEILVSLFVAIMGNIIGNLICHYLVKWLDSDQGNKKPRRSQLRGFCCS